MGKYLAYSAAGALWFAVIFFISWRMTFPSDEVTNYVSYQVHQATSGNYQVQVGSVRPWGVGAAAKEVSLFSSDPRDPNAEAKLMIALEELKVGSSIGSLVAQAPAIKGRAVIDGSKVDFEAETELQEGLFKLNAIEVETESFPFATVADLLGESMGVAMETSGGIESSIRMDLTKGFREADGAVDLTSRNLVISSLEIPMMGPLGQQIVIDDLNVEIDVDDGKAEFDKARLESEAVTLDLEGEITLREPFDRSTLKLDAVIELGEAFSILERFIASAKWDDDRYHYTISGSIGRPSFRPARQPSSRSSASSASRTPSSTTVPRPSPLSRSATDGPAKEPSSAVSDELEERRARRDEMRRRLSLGRPPSDAIRSMGDDDEFEGGDEFDGEDEFEGEEEEEPEVEEGF